MRYDLEPVLIHVENATVRFNMATEKIDNIKEYFLKMVRGQLRFQEFLALKDINFEVRRGESWGVIGLNGAGKSTLLRLICGIITPFSGSVRVSGRISPMLELGSGFSPDLTARENIFLQGALLGYSRAFMKEHFDEIVAFSELAHFLDMPIKNYSTGMHARMAFAVATVVKPDILIVDEVLSVGDAAFQKKCTKRIDEMLQGATTLLLVSHSSKTIKELCKKAVWLSKGEVVMAGDVEEVCDAYENAP